MTGQSTNAQPPARDAYVRLVALERRMLVRYEAAQQKAQHAVEQDSARDGDPRTPGEAYFWELLCEAHQADLISCTRDLDHARRLLARLWAHPPQAFTIEALRAARQVVTAYGRTWPLVAVTETGVLVDRQFGPPTHVKMEDVYGVVA